MLDAFQSFIDSDSDWERYWGSSENPSKTPEEYSLECEVKLINQINRCPKEPIEAADKGTVINELVDMIIHRRKTNLDGLTISSDGLTVVAEYNGFSWIFDRSQIYLLASLFPNAISQFLCEAPLKTSMGNVLLYGYIDEWCGNKIYDIKTTSSYQFGKFERKWQRHLYPYAVIESGMATEIESFEYTVATLATTKSEPPITFMKIIPEVYTYNHEQSRVALIEICERFIEWLESRREYITDRRIFGGTNPEGYIGTPIVLI